MKKSLFKTLVTNALLLSLVSPVAAQALSLAERFDRLDRNNDGKLTPQELPGSDVFQRLDRNRDGVIEKSELPAAAMAPGSPAESASEARVTEHLDIAYGDHERHKLDLYQPAKAKEAPIMVYIHGGGWRRGDKRGVGEKVGFFAERGWVLVSINYRLLPEGRHPANVNDAARALAWVHDHAADYGGDPEKLFVMGHSAGAHLAALVATGETPLRKAGKSRAILKGVIPLDTNTYDIAALMESGRGFYGEVFGDDPDLWKDASPITHVGTDIPPFLICYSRGMRERMNPQRPAQANAFAEALREAGIQAEVIDASDRNHGEINQWFGRADDEKVTGAAVKFLDGILRIESSVRASRPVAPPEPPATPAASAEHNSLVRFTRSYVPGTRDANGQFMGGVELMRLASHRGHLYAALGYATDRPGDDPSPGAQILVKRGPEEAWEVDQSFPQARRVNALQPVTFTTDHRGKLLQEPVTLLVAEASRSFAHGGKHRDFPLRCVVRNDQTSEWEESPICPRATRAYVRTIGTHRDRETGVDLIFAGTGAGEIYAGAYDPTAPGGLRWKPEPEYANPSFKGDSFKRVSTFCEANGEAFASVSPFLVRRTDGENPRWEEVFRWEVDEGKFGAGLRGITAIPTQEGTHEVIIGSRERPGKILRIDPKNDFKAELDLDSKAFLQEQWGVRPIGGGLTAYNRFVPGKHPLTGKPIHWVTIAAIKPGDNDAAWLLIRNADARYEIVRVFDPSLNDHPRLLSTRTVEITPWNDREIYTGGYDLWGNNQQNHNTAWIFEGTLREKGKKP